MHVIAAKAVSFREALSDEFKSYQKQIVLNAAALANGLMKRGINLVSGGTDNHLMLVDLRNLQITGKEAQHNLDEVNITCNKNGIPYDPQSPFITSGIRLGTAAVTARGMDEAAMDEIAELISLTLKDFEQSRAKVTAGVADLVKTLSSLRVRSMKEPHAYRMSPRCLEEYEGQEHILAEGKLLYRMIKADRLSSVIFFGPPGTGKTSLARIIANVTKVPFVKINAVSSGTAELKKIVSDTQNLFLNPSGRTLLFIDEIHRFNKAQQDALLPYVEDGTLILIGATTENPFFEVNQAIISRSTVFQLYPLNTQNIKNIILRAMQDPERGYGELDLKITEEALAFLAEASGGDARHRTECAGAGRAYLRERGYGSAGDHFGYDFRMCTEKSDSLR